MSFYHYFNDYNHMLGQYDCYKVYENSLKRILKNLTNVE
ncbi:hypothetical protein CCAND95_840002 [Capnocytophaga canis]|uniref:Uncharacterized protein n=1 Tax=Capnocytophaga canis TaxID=1848903 RepID=A0A0B7IEH7_9FLAO|nr:hypothetical protein CCAND95_840002 [Capnocytophaga canis]CEN49089.1 hypothetical protein CCAND38_760002 [Capnocytophaga canis]CEN50952.1 hypothetical protein CCAND93_1290002 [Capnocytophaga canis]